MSYAERGLTNRSQEREYCTEAVVPALQTGYTSGENSRKTQHAPPSSVADEYIISVIGFAVADERALKGWTKIIFNYNFSTSYGRNNFVDKITHNLHEERITILPTNSLTACTRNRLQCIRQNCSQPARGTDYNFVGKTAHSLQEERITILLTKSSKACTRNGLEFC